ncbi:MAG: penicillin-binding protein activator [Gallionella sp.]
MQRVLLLLISVLALYACTGTVPHKPDDEKPVAAVMLDGEPLPVDELIGTEEMLPEIDELEVFPMGESLPHIALLLPLRSPIFSSAANAVQNGFLAAASHERLMLPIRIYSDFDESESESVIAVYRQAIANGARAVVGPLTRRGVAALAERRRIPVPTLALNIVDGEHASKLYFFGMAIEEEARQVARLAIAQGLHQAIIVTVNSSLSQRLQAAFEEEWGGEGRGILREVEFKNDIRMFADIGDTTDTMVFLAASSSKARLIRPYLPPKIPVFASSQVFSGNESTLINYDLNGIDFVDMPWLLQPEDPAIMAFPHAIPALSIGHERLYALGVDSFQLVQLLLLDNLKFGLPLEGVSGRIRLEEQVFLREAMPARFVDGVAQPSGSAAPTLLMFPGQVVEQAAPAEQIGEQTSTQTTQQIDTQP